ncbi:Gfo/Idh/MocA family protein [Mucilaginibacter myungsuensis]|uniref:Gfo/Idh/MocA family oxidoreductase n=1 Tax=Mucilaginibacter myungsuensis TaxID=649104 RepID=A0A929PXC7_9SPHI|nr:Gfo/Idh/MocA family oxidoreductase [Mucilaginibacter myungsuensis]MBE9663723.1 Gfo/Idh/MocA family oxidoreductase [Mucilaginibacter myungsuensis]MDN3598953.1 Gfo/Idh/MocA family oxidoreductase [Mucilaginibacter myungsuensis]
MSFDEPGANKRREFLKASALVAGGVMLNGVAFAGGAAHSSVDDTIKIALIGCGDRGTGAAFQALNTKQNLKLVAMADAFADRLEKAHGLLSEKYGAKVDVPKERRFVGFDAYKQAIALADVVLLATPPGFRPWHFEEAIAQNKHVFMEKPVAVDSPGVRKVLATAKLAEQKKLNVVVGLQRRYQTSYRDTMKRIHDGAIGDITGGQVYWNSGGVWVKQREPNQTEMEYQMRNWYYFNWLCGDHITEQHIHNIDIANWIKNAHPVSVQGTGSRAWRTGKNYGEIYDNHSVELTYADGAVIHSQCRHFEGIDNRVDESFQGTKGRVLFDAGANRGRIWDTKGKQVFDYSAKTNANPYQTEHDELFEAIAKGEYKFKDAERGAISSMTSIIGRYATYSGKKISWDEALNANNSLFPDQLSWTANPKVMPDANGLYPIPTPGKTKVI